MLTGSRDRYEAGKGRGAKGIFQGLYRPKVSNNNDNKTKHNKIKTKSSPSLQSLQKLARPRRSLLLFTMSDLSHRKYYNTTITNAIHTITSINTPTPTSTIITSVISFSSLSFPTRYCPCIPIDEHYAHNYMLYGTISSPFLS